MKKIIVYTTGCPLCIALENILKQKNVEYEKVTDTEVMIAKGFQHVPMVEVEGEEIMNFKAAVKYFGGL